VNSRLTDDFLELFARLPSSVKEQARKAYRLWLDNPAHPSVQFKRIHSNDPIFAARVNRSWRVLGLQEGDTIYWFWIGSQAEYDELLKRL
jgi:hypothetical protein